MAVSRFGFQPTLWLPPSPLGSRKELLVLREAREKMTSLLELTPTTSS